MDTSVGAATHVLVSSPSSRTRNARCSDANSPHSSSSGARVRVALVRLGEVAVVVSAPPRRIPHPITLLSRFGLPGSCIGSGGEGSGGEGCGGEGSGGEG